MIDIQRILALAEMMIHHMKQFEEKTGNKFQLYDVDNDILAHLFLQGFDIEVATKLQDWRARLQNTRHDFRDDNKVSDIEFMSMLNGAHELIAGAHKIYYCGRGVHERLKNIILKIDDFLHRFEILSNILREKLNANPYENERRGRERHFNNRSANNRRPPRHRGN